MTSISRTFTVTPAPVAVIDYLKDFSNAEEWDPGTQTCTRVDSGPIAPGARWHNVSKVAGISTELDYTLDSLTADRIVFVGKNKTATSTDTITVAPRAGGGSEITYRADIEMNGIAKITGPAVKVIFERIANETEKRLTDVLNGLG